MQMIQCKEISINITFGTNTYSEMVELGHSSVDIKLLLLLVARHSDI